MNNYYVYILECKDGSFYCGITTDLQRRLNQHNNGTASKCTRARLPVKMVYHEDNHNKSTALKREAQIKKLTHKQKQELIKNSDN
ncbi:GIY-YIG nuclease family protein [uncultured Ezakiella sp.]|uniref:GIY-YIG nuclease family protein n=1 Tax=uncultured Ezakiella sp. TaxID=1637529 RepID=UPI0025FE4267|nr:GIY-YIG nuclease family protein [uncultured Ezakiella sp.]